MKRLMKFDLEDGGETYIEVIEPDREGWEEVSRTDELVERASQTFEEALKTIKPTIMAIAKTLPDIGDSTDEIAVKLGFKLGAKAGVFFVSADTEVNLEVTLIWKKRRAS